MKLINIDCLGSNTKIRAFYTTKENQDWELWCGSVQPSYIELGKELDIPVENMIRIHQTHTAGIKITNKDNIGEGIVRQQGPDGYDGLITNEKGFLLLTVQADCVPIYLYDPVREAVGMVHSGWRGSSKRIAENAVKLMTENYGCNPSDIIAATAPFICGSCYEVGGELMEEFIKNGYPENIVPSFFAPCKVKGKFYLDQGMPIKFLLTEAGLKEENIHISDICTLENKDLCSYRRDGAHAGRMLTGIILC